MVIYRFPPESENADKSAANHGEKLSEAKSPDFIYIDEERKVNEQPQGFQSDQLFAFHNLQKTSYPFFLRMITFIISVALTLWVLILSAIFLVLACIAAACLFQFPSVIKLIKQVWKIIYTMSAYALALGIATLSPVFGFGILALYTMQHGKNWRSGIFGRVFKKAPFE